MSTTTYHKHGDEIHILIMDGDKIIDHSCIALVNENRPDWPKTAEYIVRTGNAHKDLLAACEISEICFRKLADIGTLGTSKHVLLDNANMIKSVIEKANKEN